MQNGEFAKVDAMIRYYYHEETNGMDDETFWYRWAQLKYCLKKLGLYE